MPGAHASKGTPKAAEWKDCPGCPKCLPNAGLVLRRGSWRPTSSYEPVLMLAKSGKYFADGEAVKQPAASATVSRLAQDVESQEGSWRANGLMKTNGPMRAVGDDGGANLRDVWTIAAEALKERHYAAFPTELVHRCLAAGTSAKGYCVECGKPWARVVESEKHFESGSGRSGNEIVGKNGVKLQGGGDTGDIRKGPVVDTHTLGWRPTCPCKTDKPPRAGLVLDPFSGSGRTAVECQRMGLDFVGVELNEEYVRMSESILRQSMPLFA